MKKKRKAIIMDLSGAINLTDFLGFNNSVELVKKVPHPKEQLQPVAQVSVPRGTYDQLVELHARLDRAIEIIVFNYQSSERISFAKRMKCELKKKIRTLE